MTSKVFPILNADSAVKALLGSKPLRVYPWGQAPQNVQHPYATYGVFSAQPENTMDTEPQIDNQGTQIDIWAHTAKSCDECFVAIRNALESSGHMINFQMSVRDNETQLFTSRMEFDFWTAR